MLKALELTGFKSFADKTRFEFPAGITVVVGPNGSGKSNIVDAIKWVLGEQSAKSLRGKEMADVIFKGGGGSGGRKPANSATATIILDNTDRRFAFDADEVNVSRRVYRSGEAEYLINNETARLKDIRNMFRGTGIGTDAYSLIEQGKVDRLLQANGKDRRAIFEEAAGISRFKAKKVEAQRRLARVEGNLVRLSDIVEEVGSRYRSIKNQAAKAARYKEFSDRLQELRTYVGFKDWRNINDKLQKIESDNESAVTRSTELKKAIAEAEKKADTVEQSLEKYIDEVNQFQQSALQHREENTQFKATISLNETRVADLESRSSDLQAQVSRLTERLNEVETRKARFDAEVTQSKQIVENSQNHVSGLESNLQEIDGKLENLTSENEAARGESTSLIGFIKDLGQLVSAADSRIGSLNLRKSESEGISTELKNNLASRVQQLTDFQTQRQQLEADAEAKNSALADAKRNLETARKDRAYAEETISETTNTLTGKSQRRKVLMELEKRLEGVNAGAKQLLEQAKKPDAGPYREIIGVVADMISVNVQHAGIVDVALGNAAQYIVVDGEELIGLMAAEKLKVKGRVGIIQLSDPPTLGADPNVSINGEPGVIGRADRLVQVSNEYANFVRRMLGGTWIVKTLADAISLYNRGLGPIRLVTLDGEIVEADGSVIVGPKATVTGLVSRRSELRMLSKNIDELTANKQTLTEELKALRTQEKKADTEVQQLISDNTQLSQKLSDIAIRSEEIEKQKSEIGDKLQAAKKEFSSTGALLATLVSELTGNRSQLQQNESKLEELNQIVIANESSTVQLRGERTGVEQKLTQAKIDFAKSEQQLGSLTEQQEQFVATAAQLSEELARAKEQETADGDALRIARSEIETAKQKLEKNETQLLTVSEKLENVNREKASFDSQRREIAGQLNSQRDELRTLEDQLHKAELKVSHLQMERTNLAERLQEDYGIDIAELNDVPSDEEAMAQRDAIDSEISELRKKIGSIGSVNMDALAELEDLEQRYNKMDEQYQDLVAAKQSLENIIQRINTDSRRLFVETLEAIRENFKTLFRQAFGGGKADIVLEEGVDPLEAGVEIVVTPPGKSQFNNSLLSGGEKALTAVSLLMAIFQFRPSPFCVLDEVDAPFDEANVGRFIDVLKSFLGWTKFVIVTHSKKTMTAATTLYGVTMQESGVSKRVSVRFEDVGEDGKISDAAVNRGEEDAA